MLTALTVLLEASSLISGSNPLVPLEKPWFPPHSGFAIYKEQSLDNHGHFVKNRMHRNTIFSRFLCNRYPMCGTTFSQNLLQIHLKKFHLHSSLSVFSEPVHSNINYYFHFNENLHCDTSLWYSKWLKNNKIIFFLFKTIQSGTISTNNTLFPFSPKINLYTQILASNIITDMKKTAWKHIDIPPFPRAKSAPGETPQCTVQQVQ